MDAFLLWKEMSLHCVETFDPQSSLTLPRNICATIENIKGHADASRDPTCITYVQKRVVVVRAVGFVSQEGLM